MVDPARVLNEVTMADYPMYVTKTCDITGEQITGSAIQFARLTGNKSMEAAAMPWPAGGSKERREMDEYAITMALLMGMEPAQASTDGLWRCENMIVSVGFHKSQGELACAYINVKGFWVVRNQRGDWECVRI